MIDRFFTAFRYTVVIVFFSALMFPFLWIFLSSVKPLTELFGEDAFKYFTANPTIAHYISIFVNYPFLRYLWNSFIIATVTTVYSVSISAAAAYAVARFNFIGKTILLGVVLAIAMFPPIAIISPLYIFLKNVGLTNSYLGLMIPYTTFAIPFSMWLLVMFFKKVPWTLAEAAKIDGANSWQIFYRIFLPLSLPGIFTTAILTFITVWNEFLFALTINTDDRFKTIPVGIAMFQGQYTIPWGEITAVTVVVTIPLVIMVFLFQKRIISGITAGAVKE
ncbi:MAG TPA: carbohydrate ABC transporter permease [Spirochaetota bacterium]|nr:carbohydrate ABC transporter permease [Spirochaetota bacterium]